MQISQWLGSQTRCIRQGDKATKTVIKVGLHWGAALLSNHSVIYTTRLLAVYRYQLFVRFGDIALPQVFSKNRHPKIFQRIISLRSSRLTSLHIKTQSSYAVPLPLLRFFYVGFEFPLHALRVFTRHLFIRIKCDQHLTRFLVFGHGIISDPAHLL